MCPINFGIVFVLFGVGNDPKSIGIMVDHQFPVNIAILGVSVSKNQNTSNTNKQRVINITGGIDGVRIDGW